MVLTQLPEVPMTKVLGYVDYCDVVSLQKTCHHLRNFISNYSPDSKIHRCTITIDTDSIDLKLNFGRDFDLWPGGGVLRLHYTREEELSWFRSDGRRIVPFSGDFLEFFHRDLRLALKNQKSEIEDFVLNFEYFPGLPEDHPVFEAISEKLLGNLEQYLKDRPRPLLVPEFYTSVFELDQVLKVLPNLARVNKISITNRKPGSWNIEELVKHEQWKNAEIIHIFDRNLVAEIRDFEGFEDVNLQFERMMVKEVMQWKEMITKSPKMKSGKINFKTSDAEAHFLRTHGPPSEDTDQFGDDRRNWFFRLPDEESVLQISFYKKWFRFARVELKEVTGIVIE